MFTNTMWLERILTNSVWFIVYVRQHHVAGANAYQQHVVTEKVHPQRVVGEIAYQQRVVIVDVLTQRVCGQEQMLATCSTNSGRRGRNPV